MSYKENLKPAFKHVPFWVLAIVIVMIGLPLHIFLGILSGVYGGLKNWKSEANELFCS